MYVCMRQILSGLYIGTAIVPVSHKTLIALASAQKTASFQNGVDRGVGDKGHQIRLDWMVWYGMGWTDTMISARHETCYGVVS